MARTSYNAARRLFLKQGAAVSALGVGAPFALNLAAMGEVAAATATGYKALVCVFLSGGNDSYNTVLATDPGSWDAYYAVRNQQPSPICLSRATLLDLAPVTAIPGRYLALHAQLPGLQSLFNTQRRMAIVSNVGPLIEPLSKLEYTRATKRIPARLFSHNDQQSSWQALAPEGSAQGWGGRLADALVAGNGKSLFTAISTTGNSVWLSGQTVKQYQLQPSGVVRLGVQADASGTDRVFGSANVAAALKRVAQGAYATHTFERDISTVAQRSIQADSDLGSQLPSTASAPFGGTDAVTYTKLDGVTRAVNPLAQQLQLVARTIAARASLGMTRQVFFVSLPGFDTHDLQLTKHADLMAKLNHGLTYFDAVLQSMGLSDSVTTFTASDFGRTFTSNGDGTDHGWGGHHFVMGGAVRGGTVVGDIPIYAYKNSSNNQFDGSPDQLANGVLLPKISVEQYGAALGRWFGADAALDTVFPNARSFNPLSLMI